MISIIRQPSLYTPANSPVQFQLSGSTANIVYFGVQVLDAESETVIANQKYQTLPNYLNGTAFDLSSILSAYVGNQMITSDNLIEPTRDIFQSYKLIITEYAVSGNSIVSGDTLTTGTYNVWNAELDRVNFNGYSYPNYVLTTSGNTIFLTNKPNISNLYQSSDEYLYFLTSINWSVKYDFYGSGNTLLGSHTLTVITGTSNCYRLNVSPGVLNEYFGFELSNMYGGEFQDMFQDPFGTNYTINNANYFTVQLLNSGGTTKSEIRTYVLRKDNCKAEPVQLLFNNSLGGFDGVTFFNPLESLAVTKSSITTYPYKLNADGDYTNINNGVYNETDIVYNIDKTSTYKIFSEVLDDATASWIKGLIEAETVYIKLADETLLPITITTNNYNILKRKYNTNNNRLQIEFKVKESGLNF